MSNKNIDKQSANFSFFSNGFSPTDDGSPRYGAVQNANTQPPAVPPFPSQYYATKCQPHPHKETYVNWVFNTQWIWLWLSLMRQSTTETKAELGFVKNAWNKSLTPRIVTWFLRGGGFV